MRTLKQLILSTVLLAFWSCQKEEEVIVSDLSITGTYSLDIKEPSGLSFDATSNALLVVSDNENKAYKISKTGQILQTYAYTGSDLEGISFIDNQTLLLAEERQRTIVKYNILTNFATSYTVDVAQTDANSGIEGVCYVPSLRQTYVVNEKNPVSLIVLNENFEKEAEYSLSYLSDVSDVCYDNYRKLLWILSDENQSLILTDLQGQKIKQYTLDIVQPEGLVVDEQNQIIYIVSDRSEKLYTLKYPAL